MKSLAKYILLSYLLTSCLSAVVAGNSNLYGNSEKIDSKETLDSGSLFKNLDDGEFSAKNDFSLDLYGDTPLKAPPGGGDPIGGVAPVSDGIWILLLLAAGYVCFQYRRRLICKLRRKFRKNKRKTKVKGLFIAMALVPFSGMLCAQSMYWGDSKDKEYMRMTGRDTYVTFPTGDLPSYYKIVDDTCLYYVNGNVNNSLLYTYSYKKLNDRIEFFRNGDMIAYCIPSQGRFYHVSTVDGEIAKEVSIAVLLHGKLYDGMGVVRFTVDDGLSLEAVGIFLLMNS